MDVGMRNEFDTIRIPITQQAVRSPTATSFLGTADQTFINCFQQSVPDPKTGEHDTWVTKRPGIRKVTGIDFTGILGAVNSIASDNLCITALNDVYVAAIYDATNVKFVIIQYRPVTGTVTKLGEILATNGFDQCFLTELSVANTATLGVVWNSSNGTTSEGHYATSVAGVFPGGSLTKITDIDFPPNAASPLPLVGPMVQMNGTTYVLTNTGEIHGSDINSITAWNSLNMLQATSYPDQGVALVRYKSHVVCFGENTIEFFSDVGNANASPLQRQDQAFIKFGCIHAKALVSVDDAVYWLARSNTGSIGMHKLEGYTPMKVTGPVEDQIIEGSVQFSGLYGAHKLSCVLILGQKTIIIGGAQFRAGLIYSSPGAGYVGDPHGNNGQASQLASGVLAYNIQEQSFWGWRQNGYGNTDAFPLSVSQYQLSNSGASIQYMIMCGSSNASGLGAYVYSYPVDSYYWTDQLGNTSAESYYQVILQTNRWMNNNSQFKRIHKFKLIFDQMFSEPSNPETGAWLHFVWIKDTWDPSNGVAQSRSMVIPASSARYFIPNLGASRTWGFGFTTMNAMSMRLRAVEVDVSQGSQ
jgi:hypothetical protein